MSLSTLMFRSIALGKSTAANLLVPEGDGPFPVVFLLHGLSDDHTTWIRNTRLEGHPEAAPFLIVMPDGGRSFYCNHPGDPYLRYEDFLTQELLPRIDRMFHTDPRRERRATAGLSMGGYGALMLALRHPDLFSAACSHSGAVFYLQHQAPDRPDIDAITRGLSPDDYSLYRLAERAASGSPAIRMDCGTDDFLLDANRDFHRHLERLGIAHAYHEFPGGHTWDYWDLHIRESLAFLRERMGV